MKSTTIRPSVELPAVIESEETLDEIMTRPRPVMVECIRTLQSPLVILGAGGKMGPTLAVLAKRAAEAAGHRLDIIAVSRVAHPQAREWLEGRGVRTISCDLLESEAVKRLPDSVNLIYLVGLKFGTAENPGATWAMNTLVPAHVTQRFPRARIVALSSGNIYPLVPASSGGSVETDSVAPVGEYPNAVLARERIFQFYSQKNQTLVVLVRLNYAVDLRYGVLVDIAQKVHRGEPIDVTMGDLNCIWQGDANEFILRSLTLASAPPAILNLTGPAVLSVRELALQFSQLLGRSAHIVGVEAETALLNNPARICALFGPPATAMETVMRWTAHWISQHGRLLNKPTHFEVRNGKY